MIIWDNTKVINAATGTNVSINTTNIKVSTTVAHTDIAAANINIWTSLAHTDIAAANIKVANSSYVTDIGVSAINISNTAGQGNYITVNTNEIRVFGQGSYTTIGPANVTTSAITTCTVRPDSNGRGTIGTPSYRYGTGYINDLTSNNISPSTNITGNIGSSNKQYNYAYVNCISSRYHYNSDNNYVTTNIPLSLNLAVDIDHGNEFTRPYDVIDFLTLFFYSVDKQFLRYLYREPHVGATPTYNMQPLQSWNWSQSGLYLNFGTAADTYAFLNLPMSIFAENSTKSLSLTFSRDQMLGGTKEFIIPDILPVTFDAKYLGDISTDSYDIKYEGGQHYLVLPADGGPYFISDSGGDTIQGIYPVSKTDRKIQVDCNKDIIVWRRGYWPAWRGGGNAIGDTRCYSQDRGDVNLLKFWNAGY